MMRVRARLQCELIVYSIFVLVLNQYAAVINLPCAQRAERENFVHHVAAALKLKLKLKLASFINVKYNFFTYFVRRRWHDNGSTFPPWQKNTMQNIINWGSSTLVGALWPGPALGAMWRCAGEALKMTLMKHYMRISCTYIHIHV